MADNSAITFDIIVEIDSIRYYLDVYGVDSIPMVYNIANINDISTTKGPYSLPITLPETANNLAVLGNITSANFYSDSYNPLRRHRVYVLVDSVLVLEGAFQATNFTINDFNHYNTIDVLITSDNNDFYNVIAEEYIETCDLSRFNHVWNATNIVRSWTQSYANGYYYPLIDYGYDWTITTMISMNGYTGVNVKDMYSAVYARVIWDQIFQEAEFTWTSSSLTQSTPFNELIVPYNGDKILQADDYVSLNQFQASLTANQNITNPNGLYSQTANNLIQHQQPAWSAGGLLADKWTTRVKFDNTTPPTNGDPNGLWSNTLWEYTNTGSASVVQQFSFQMTIEQAFLWPADNYPYLILKRGANVPVQTSQNWLTTNYYPVYPGNTNWSYSNQKIFAQWDPVNGYQNYETYTSKWSTPQMTIAAGEKVWLEYVFPLYASTKVGPLNSNIPISGSNIYAKINMNAYINNQVSNQIFPGGTVVVSSMLPKKIKKRDFILSIIKMFNLVVESDPNNQKNLIINTRDYFYSVGQIEDWTQKVDHEQPINESLLSNKQNKLTILKYKEDKDYLNTDYKSQTNLTYGEYQYTVDNDFIDGTKTTEIIFSPTPMAGLPYSPGLTAGANIIIPKIGILNNGQFQRTAHNIRILQKKYIQMQAGSWLFEGAAFNKYPYSGHLDDPGNPYYDINFGQTLGLYYPSTIVTNYNLFNAYWSQMLDEISDRYSRLTTMYIYLSTKDIADFRFNKNIFIDLGDGGAYYKVNRIDYDPTKIGPSKVEFIKTKFISVPKAAAYYKQAIFAGAILGVAVIKGGPGGHQGTA